MFITTCKSCRSSFSIKFTICELPLLRFMEKNIHRHRHVVVKTHYAGSAHTHSVIQYHLEWPLNAIVELSGLCVLPYWLHAHEFNASGKKKETSYFLIHKHETMSHICSKIPHKQNSPKCFNLLYCLWNVLFI